MSIASIFTLSTAQTAMELGCIYALVALALFLSYSILNIADLSTDSCFTLGCAVCCQVTLLGHPILALFAAMLAGVLSGYITAFLQTRLGVESILAGIIVNTGLYTVNLAVMGFSSTLSIFKCDNIFSMAKSALGGVLGSWYKLVVALVIVLAVAWLLVRKVVRHPVGILACCLILSGGIGNILDRLRLGYVVDMLHFQFWPSYPTFNVADMCIVSGAVLGAVYYVYLYEKHDRRKPNGADDATGNG